MELSAKIKEVLENKKESKAEEETDTDNNLVKND